MRSRPAPWGSAVVFGSAITSGRFDGATIFFRGLCRALARTGLPTIFAEESRQLVPDAGLPAGVEVRHYGTPSDVSQLLASAETPRLVLKFVECGPLDGVVEEAILSSRQPSDLTLFVDGDAPVILAKIRRSPDHYLRRNLPRFDGVLVLAGGELALQQFLALGVSRARWGYCAADGGFWHPVAPAPEFEGDLLFAGNRLPDRDARMEEFFFHPAGLCPDLRFLLTGSGWEGMEMPANLRRLGHLTPEQLRQAYSSAALVLNVNREPMARYGYSPASRLFEAAACGACMVSDHWPGIEELFLPGKEILLSEGADGIVAALRGADPESRRRVGLAARERVLRDYTCDGWVRWLFETISEWGYQGAKGRTDGTLGA